MKDNSLLETLREVSFLRGVADEYIEKIVEIAERAEFPEGKIIFREGEPASHIYLIVRGNVSLEICASGVGCKRILTLGAGDVAGLSPVLEHTRLTATARAISPTEALKISGNQILAVCEHNPRFGYEFMRKTALALSKRLVATRMQLLDVYGNTMPNAGRKGSTE